MEFKCDVCNKYFSSKKSLNIHISRMHKKTFSTIKEEKPIIKKIEKPLIEPRDKEWECWQTFNPGAVVIDNKVHFLYRAIGRDFISRFGYANSKDGFKLDERLENPVYEHEIIPTTFNPHGFVSGGSFGGAEDPRIVEIEGNVYVTYTAVENNLRIALTSIKTKDFVNKQWKWSKPKLLSPPNENHKNWALFPEKINGKFALIHSISPFIQITYVEDFERQGFIRSYYDGNGTSENGWEGRMKGIGAPPIKTKYGWLVLYHAIPKKGEGYCIGAMVLDSKNPTKILYKAKEPILTPFDVRNGIKPFIVYSNGAVVKDDKLLIYYGAADTWVNVAYAYLDEFLQKLIEDSKPTLEKGLVKK